MPSETKAGIAIILVLIGAFGFIAYTKYGQGLKDKTLAAIKGKAPDETTGPESGEPDPEGPPDPPSAFDNDEDTSGRVALNEDEIFGDQGEPAASAGIDDGWGVPDEQPTAPASATVAGPPASESDPFAGFESTQRAATPAAQTRITDVQETAADFSDSAFDDLGTAQTDSQSFQPAAPTEAVDPWPSTVNDTAPVATREPANVRPREPARMEPQPVSQPAPAADPFGDPFGDSEPVASTPAAREPAVQQPAPWADPADVQPKDAAIAFDDAAIFGDDPVPAAEPQRAPVAFSEPAPRERTVTQPAPAQPDPFAESAIDFSDGSSVTSGRTEVVSQPTKPPERFDRGGFERRPVERTDRTVSRPVDPSDMSYYTVAQSDTYWAISKKVYGTARYYRALAKYNERIISDPRRMRPGTRLEVPPIRELERLYPKMFPSVRVASATRVDRRQKSGLYYDVSGNPIYQVGSNDTLSRIAYRHLGRASRWSDIYNLNRDQLTSPEAVRPGMILKMPRESSQVATRDEGTRR